MFFFIQFVPFPLVMLHAQMPLLARSGNTGIVGGWGSRVAGRGRGSKTIGLRVALFAGQVNSSERGVF
jgi:hypothetical protein